MRNYLQVFGILWSENRADMIRYKSTRQMSIEEFKTPFQVKLDKGKRWVKLGNSLPWNRLARIYYRGMSSDQGAPAIDARIVIGAKTKSMLNFTRCWVSANKTDMCRSIPLAGKGTMKALI